MDIKFLIYTVSAIFLAFSVWCFVDGIRVSRIDLIGGFAYLVLAVFIYKRSNVFRFLAFAVLALHIGFSIFILLTVFKMGWTENEGLKAFADLETASGDGVMYVDIGNARKTFLIIKSLVTTLVLGYCFFVLTNSNVIGLFEGKGGAR
jgi:hypothetical protein